PITKDVHDDYMKRAQLPPALMQGPGYDLHKALPVYSWQIFDLVLKILQDQSQGQKVAKNVGIDTVKPIFEKSVIRMEANFSNQSVRLGDFQLNFGPLAANEKHRIRVTGSLYEPVVTVNGLKGVELSGPAGKMRLANAEEKLPPLTIRIHVD